MLYIHRDRTFKVPVTIDRVLLYIQEEPDPRRKTVPSSDRSYVVRSELGGTLHVSGSQLRPGTVLDRLADVLDEPE